VQKVLHNTGILTTTASQNMIGATEIHVAKT